MPNNRPLPPVFLNHFYAVLDSATYQAVEESAFWRSRFAPNEKRTTVRTDQTYTGLYFYGTNTYFEFFDVADSRRPEMGEFGIAFGVEVPEAIDALRESFGADLEVGRELITRLYRGEQVPWFYMGTFESLPCEARTSTWLMEYHADFLATWNPRPDSSTGPRAGAKGILRRDVLRRYADVVEPVKDPYLEDVVGLTVAVEPAIRDSFVGLIGRLGYDVRRTDEGGSDSVELRGPDFVLRLVSVEGGPRGVREISMRTGRSLPNPEPQQFGRSVLSGAGRRAVLSLQ